MKGITNLVITLINLVISGILVSATVYYARKTNEMIKEIRNDRERDAIKEIISDVVDPLIEDLKDFQSILTEENGILRKPRHSTYSIKRDTAWIDFSRRNRSLSKEIEKYWNFKNKYTDTYIRLRESLQEKVENIEAEGFSQSVYPTMRKHQVNQVKPAEFLKRHSFSIVEILLK